ncbi:MAG: M23 family metallopeptidase [Syntrophaceticus sp.]|nr:M23 family metallopeptidase [Syntrophaceticus sp.]MDD3314249.1 M23 family metallopeptidase [Syntrophaceticus sp.]MDD4359844.1 M23 family metallopeptidase [Syntrophaceticus sp.]MDD4782415.1 M23 family metallopeptidase [Syntrophaceticus sp.]
MNRSLGYTRPKSARVRRLKNFCLRLAAAVIIFGMIVLVSASGGSSGQAVREGVSYVLTKDYDFSGYEKKMREAISLLPELSVPGIKRDLEVRVSTSGTSGGMSGLPASGELVRGFGWQKDDSNWPYYYEGVELSVDKGAFVRAVLPGKVVRVVTDEERGGVVIIEHAQDCATLYRWLEDIEVKTGQDVTDDQVIGTAADTILYFQFREGDRLVDPVSRLQK